MATDVRRLAHLVVGTPAILALAIVVAASTSAVAPSAIPTPGVAPTSTVATASAASTSITTRRPIVIQAVGDVSLDPRYLPVLRSAGWGWPWGGLGGIFRDDDLTIVNLECPATTVVRPVEKEFNFRCDPLALPAMRAAGVEVASQANNHAFDQGAAGLLDSLVQVRAAGIRTVGAGRTLADAMAPAIVEVGGWRIAIVGIGQVIDPPWMTATSDRPGTTNGHDARQVLSAIRVASVRSDLVIAVIHWGIERDTTPQGWQVDFARRMVAAGADIVFGHHAHRLQPLGRIDGRPVFYGLGNFVWPRLSSEGARTAVARVIVRPDGTILARLIPATIVSAGRPVLDPPPA